MPPLTLPEGISIHAPRTGSDHSGRRAADRTGDFNPRSPHGERQTDDGATTSIRHFNPRSPHGERQKYTQPADNTIGISIHAPRTGSDSDGRCFCTSCIEFQSTLPARGATDRAVGGRVSTMGFQSTLPARGATVTIDKVIDIFKISIHAPRTGSDVGTSAS